MIDESKLEIEFSIIITCIKIITSIINSYVILLMVVLNIKTVDNYNIFYLV